MTLTNTTPARLASTFVKIAPIMRLKNISRQLPLIAGFFVVWQYFVWLSNKIHENAVAHGLFLWNIERTLHLPNELLLANHARVLTWYYLCAHSAAMLVTVVFCAAYSPRYLKIRNTILLSTAISFLLELWEVAPPRLLTIGITGVNLSHLGIDQFSAFPSLHVVWATIVALAAWRNRRTRIFALHLPITIYVVIATGNHTYLDCLFGVAIALGAWKWADSYGQSWDLSAGSLWRKIVRVSLLRSSQA